MKPAKPFFPSVVFAVACCCHPDPHIASFHVTPVGYCPSGGQSIHVEWQTGKGDATLQVEPEDATPRSVPNNGSYDYPAHDSVVTLMVAAGELRPHVIQPVHPVDHHSLNALATRCESDWVSADPADFGGALNAYAVDVHPAVISNKCSPMATSKSTCRRPVKVEHAGKTWELAPDAVLNVTRDATPMNGPWTLSQKLLPGEACGTESASGALEIDLVLEIGCTKGAIYEQ